MTRRGKEGCVEEVREQRREGVPEGSRKNAGCKVEMVSAPPSTLLRAKWGD